MPIPTLSSKTLLSVMLAVTLLSGCATPTPPKIAAEDNVLHLHLSNSGVILVNGKKHPLADIGPIVSKFVAKSRDTAVQVVAPSDVPVETMAALLQSCIRAGALNIDQVAEPPAAK